MRGKLARAKGNCFWWRYAREIRANKGQLFLVLLLCLVALESGASLVDQSRGVAIGKAAKYVRHSSENHYVQIKFVFKAATREQMVEQL